MHNIPVTLKLQIAIDRGNTQRAQDLLDKYDFIIHPTFNLQLAIRSVAQIEFYELQLAKYLSRRFSALHFVQKFSTADNPLLGPSLRRSLGFIGPDDLECTKRFVSLRDVLDHWFYMRHARLKKGSASGESYRSGFMEAILDRQRSEVRDEEFYISIIKQVKLRDTISSKRRDLRDQGARSLGLDDGLIVDLMTLNFIQ